MIIFCKSPLVSRQGEQTHSCTSVLVNYFQESRNIFMMKPSQIAPKATSEETAVYTCFFFANAENVLQQKQYMFVKNEPVETAL